MKIGIGACNRGSNHTEVAESTYFQGLIKGLLSIDRVNEYFIFANLPEATARTVRGHANARVIRPCGAALSAAWHRLDLFHAGRIVPLGLRIPTAVTVPDINFEFHPQDVPLPELKRLRATVRENCERARLVFAGSALCRRQLQETWGLPLDKIVVTAAAADHVSDRAGFSRTPCSLGLPPRYIVFAGGAQQRHNLPRMLAAFDRLVSRTGVPHCLVIPAPQGESDEDLRHALRPMRNRSRVLVLRDLCEADLHVTLRAADVFACPALYDGPGLSATLAQWFDVPCLVSNTGSFPETYGDSALFCDPLDEGSIASALERLVREPLLRSELAVRGAERTSRCSWRHTAAVALEAYRRLALVEAGARTPATLEAR